MAKIAEPMIEQIRPSRLSTGAAPIAPVAVSRPQRDSAQHDKAAPVVIQKRQPVAATQNIELRKSETRKPEMVPSSVASREQMKVAPSAPEIIRPSRMADHAPEIGVQGRPSKMASSLEMPSGPAGFESDRRPLGSPEPMPRIKEKTPLIFGVDPTQAIAAARSIRKGTEDKVDERREPFGFRDAITYSKLVGNQGQE